MLHVFRLNWEKHGKIICCEKHNIIHRQKERQTGNETWCANNIHEYTQSQTYTQTEQNDKRALTSDATTIANRYNNTFQTQTDIADKLAFKLGATTISNYDNK